MSNPISGGTGGIENRFSVPPKQWNELGPEGQEHFNRLFMKVQRKKPAWLKNQPFTEKQLQQMEPLLGKIMMGICLTACQETLQAA
jgi:hypothetical protein